MLNQPFLTLTLAAALTLSSPLTMAHSTPETLHGGIVKSAHHQEYELIHQDQRVNIYISDHGQPVNTEGMSGKLVIMQNREKSELTLTAKPQMLTAHPISLQPGAKVIARIKKADGETISLRYSID